MKEVKPKERCKNCRIEESIYTASSYLPGFIHWRAFSSESTFMSVSARTCRREGKPIRFNIKQLNLAQFTSVLIELGLFIGFISTTRVEFDSIRYQSTFIYKLKHLIIELWCGKG